MDSFGTKRRFDEDSKADFGNDATREDMEGIGGYGDDDFTDVKSLVANNKDGFESTTIDNFGDFPEIVEKTKEKLRELGIKYLFPIQIECFKHIYEGSDLIGRDLTGSGKTLAFCIPLVEKFRKEGLFKENSYLKTIMLAPTRELALQVSKVLKCLRHHGDEFRVITVYGGVPINMQTQELRKGVDFFVGTTGRVMDHIRRGNIDFTKMRAVVLDEADQMLNMGFAEDIEVIMKSMQEKASQKQQFILFSATIPDWIKDTAAKYMTQDYQYINLAANLTNKTPKNVTHILVNTPSYDRASVLESIMRCYCEDKDSKSIIFTTTKNDAREIAQLDILKGKAEALHGDVPQYAREKVLKRFRAGSTNTLVATDVASRGLDIPRVNLIVQIEPPKDPESYIHRSGRTARAGNQGICITLYSEKDQNYIDRIIQTAGIQFKEVSPEELKALSGSSSNANSTSRSTKSLITGKSGTITYTVTGFFANKGVAYKSLCDSLTSELVNSMKCVNMIKDNEGVCFDIPDDKETELWNIFKKAQNDGVVSFAMEKTKKLPTFA
jgi:ATP-dependent RNA helicase DDX21